MRTAEINAIVDKAYDALDVVNNMTWTPYRDNCYAMAVAEERTHRRMGLHIGHAYPRGATVEAAAKLFVVKRIAEALTASEQGSTRKLTIRDLIRVQPSACYAASIAANYGAECMTALGRERLGQLADELDYVQFVNDGEPQS